MDESNQISVADHTDVIDLTANIVAAYVSNNSVRPADLPALLSEVHAAITGLNGTSATAAPAVEKATPSQIRKSITPDALISFIDGKPYKSLKRHLTSNGTSPDEYRQKYGLPRDYPMVAATYAAQRSELAKSLGLGQLRRDRAAAKKAAEKRAEPDPVVTAPVDAKPARRGRPKKSAASAAE